jgi:hypothetical protein
VSRYHLLSDAAADADIEAAFEWYESEQPELGFEFLDEVRATYNRILDGPFKYQEPSIWHQARPDEKISIWSLFFS